MLPRSVAMRILRKLTELEDDPGDCGERGPQKRCLRLRTAIMGAQVASEARSQVVTIVPAVTPPPRQPTAHRPLSRPRRARASH